MRKRFSQQPLILFLAIAGGCNLSFGRIISATASPDLNSASSVSCPSFSPLTHTLQSPENALHLPAPTSHCAHDLMGAKSSLEFVQTPSETPIIKEDDSPLPPIEIPSIEEDNRWHFKFQPYVTVPVSIYGSSTVRGRTVDYHLSLGETLQHLRVAASGRFEGWKGRWGFIVDGYYASLTGIVDFQKAVERMPNTINALNYLLSKDVNTQAQNLAHFLSQDVERLENVEELRESQAVQNLRQTVQTFQETVAQDAQTLRELEEDLQNFQAEVDQRESQLEAVDFDLQQREFLNLNEVELQQAITLNNQSEQENFNERIETAIMKLESLDSFQQQLAKTRNLLEQTSQQISELRAIEDSPELQQLETDVENAKAIVDRDIQAINEIENFADNRDPQMFDANLSTDLQFNQGIYDFALSYHIGELPLTELPETPSNRPYPLVWFQPIAGVRLNDISVTIQETINLSLSSSLASFQGTFQETLEGGRTWFEPMLGGKLGLQISDPIIFWVRGDVSGFGLAGETDFSWNVFFGVDWWVRRDFSLQFAYHFYSIDYQIGTGNNAFGFTENLNGPYLSATFHF